MPSGQPTSAASGVQLPQTRSFPNLVAYLLFSQSVRSPMTTDHVPEKSNRMLATDDDQQSCCSSCSTAVSVSGLLGSPFEQDSFNWVDTETIAHTASSPPTSMRRSETWSTSFQRPNDLIQNASRLQNETSAGSGSQSISATGSSSIRALQRSLSDIFAPNKVVIDAHEDTGHETREVAFNQSSSVSKIRSSLPQLSTSKLSTPSCPPDVSMATPVAVHDGQPHPKAMLRRQWSLVAVQESDPTREIQQSGHPNAADAGLSNGSASLPAEPRSMYADENQNVVCPVVFDRNSEGALRTTTTGEMTSQGHVMQVPETVSGRPSRRRFGIMELLGAGERKNVRNKDVNLMAPQSW